jgi:2-oxoglutarate ferredoxin oxidoreductase subunit alpha
LSDALVRVDSDEHDEEGKITEEPGMRIQMVNKRRKKFRLLSSELVLPSFYGDRVADSFVICWGSTKLIVKEAVERLIEEGISTALLHFGQVYPLLPEMVAPYGLKRKRLIIVENNVGGPFAGLLKSELDLEMEHSILKYDGNCFTVEELYQTLKDLLTKRSQ